MKRLSNFPFKRVRNLILIGLCVGLGFMIALPLLDAYQEQAAIRTVYFRNSPLLTTSQMQTAQTMVATYSGIIEHEIVDEGRALKVTFDTRQLPVRQIRYTLDCISENVADIATCVSTRLTVLEETTGS